MKLIKKFLLAGILAIPSFAGLLATQNTAKATFATDIPAGQTLDANPDNITIHDLTFVSVADNNDTYAGLTNQTMLPQSRNTDVSYNKTNENGSLIFRLKYDFNDHPNGQDRRFRIHFDVADDKWNTDNALWVIENNVGMWSWTGDKYDVTWYGGFDLGVHTIEFGRIALLEDGVPTGNYYVYYKLDGTEIGSAISPYDVSKIDNTMFINTDYANRFNRIYDADYTYEAPTKISVSDLTSSGVLKTYDDGTGNFSYTSTATNGSVIFAADLDLKDPSKTDNQFYVYKDGDLNWDNAGFVKIQGNKQIVIGKNDADGVFSKMVNGNVFQWTDVASSANTETVLGEGQTYHFEYGRLAIMNGETFTGKYHTYVKINGAYAISYDQAYKTGVAEGGMIHMCGGGWDYLDVNSYEAPKVISVGDLSYDGAKLGDKVVTEGQKVCTYDNTDHTDNYSVVFKFKYIVNSETLNQNQFHLTDQAHIWDTISSFILLNGGSNAHVGTSGGWRNGITLGFDKGETHDIELGRVAKLFAGEFTGTYRVYLKVDGEVIDEVMDAIPLDVASANNVFITADAANIIQDIDYTDEVLDTPATVTLCDLAESGIIEAPQSWTGWSYTTAPSATSVVFKFILSTTTLTDETSMQFYRDDVPMLQVKNDNGKAKFYFAWTHDERPTDYYYLPEKALLADNTDYKIEMGSIKVTGGSNAGKALVYLKVNNEYLDRDGTKSMFYVSGDKQPWVGGNDRCTMLVKEGMALKDESYVPQVPEQLDTPTVFNVLDIYGQPTIHEADNWPNFKFNIPTGVDSKVFRFKVETGEITNNMELHLIVNDVEFLIFRIDDSVKMGGYFCFALDGRPTDKYYIGGDSSNWFESNSSYILEFGIIKVTAGTNVGKDYYYMKIDDEFLLRGEIESQFYLDASQDPFKQGENKIGYKLVDLELLDANYVAPTYETPDEIHLHDTTYLDGTPVKGSIALTEYQKITWTPTAEHNSVVITFDYDVKGEKPECQFHFNNGFIDDSLGGVIWLQGVTVIRKDLVGAQTDYVFAEGIGSGLHHVEVGQIYITSGTGAGNYRVYVTVDGTLLAEWVGAMSGECILFLTGTNNDVLIDPTYVHVCELTHHDGVAGTCLTAGTIEYWECEECGKKYSDAEGKTEITSVAGDAAHVDSLTHHEATAASCTTDGNIEYWECEECGKKYSDAEGTTVISDVLLPAHHTAEHVAANDPSCTTEGNVEYWHCSVCNKNFSDEACTTELESVTVAARHALRHVEANEATCVEDGNIEYWHCSECGKNFLDEAGTQLAADITVPATGVHHYGDDHHCEDCGMKDPSYHEETSETTSEVTSETTSVATSETTSTPATSETPGEPEKIGCKGSIAAAGMIISILSLAGIGLIAKRKEN